LERKKQEECFIPNVEGRKDYLIYISFSSLWSFFFVVFFFFFFLSSV
jgi:hypothetical protein